MPQQVTSHVLASEARHGSPLGANDLLHAAAMDALRAESGLRWIHRWLQGLKAAQDLDDVVLIFHDPLLGRQVFRAGRHPFRGEWATRIALQGEPGLYTLPARRTDANDVALVIRLCSMALELDVMRDLSLHDPLTGLHNRRGFDEFIDQALEQNRRYGWPFALVLIDLDDFKRLNDKVGHAAGDAVLRAVGDEIAHALRRGDVAARVGGDEFALVLSGTEGDAVPSLLGRLRNRLETDVPHAPVRFSAGAASCPHEAANRDDLFTLADRRLYMEKAR